jgi:hypothetical protein
MESNETDRQPIGFTDLIAQDLYDMIGKPYGRSLPCILNSPTKLL